jgi:hypothetical protein
MAKHRIYTMSFARVYPLLVAKAEKKGRTKADVDKIISWLTGYGKDNLKTICRTAPISKPSLQRHPGSIRHAR